MTDEEIRQEIEALRAHFRDVGDDEGERMVEVMFQMLSLIYQVKTSHRTLRDRVDLL